MAAQNDHGTLFERLIALNHEAFAAAHYNTAYHTLAAALHEAQHGQDAASLAAMQRVAAEQLARIDQTAPGYKHSTSSAAARGHTSIFAVLASQAHARPLLVQHEPVRRRAAPAS